MRAASIFRLFVSVACVVVLACCSFIFVLFCIIRTLVTPDALEQVVKESRIAERLVPSIVDAYITPEALAENDIHFLTLAQAKTILNSTFEPAWVEAHLLLFVQQGYRLLEPKAQLSDSVFLISLEQPKKRFLKEYDVLKPQIPSSAALSSFFQSMEPSAMIAVLPEHLNILRFMIPNSATTAPTDYDPFGLRMHDRPLTQEEVDILAPQQKTLETVQNVIQRIDLMLPAFIGLACIALFIIVLTHIHQHTSVFRWLGLVSLFASLPWILSDVFLLHLIPNRIQAELAILPQPIGTELFLFIRSYLRLIAYQMSITAVVLLIVCIACFLCAWALPFFKKRSSIS